MSKTGLAAPVPLQMIVRAGPDEPRAGVLRDATLPIQERVEGSPNARPKSRTRQFPGTEKQTWYSPRCPQRARILAVVGGLVGSAGRYMTCCTCTKDTLHSTSARLLPSTDLHQALLGHRNTEQSTIQAGLFQPNRKPNHEVAFVSRKVHLLTISGIVAHHTIETIAGIGLPGEPDLGRRRAAITWAGAVGTDLYLVFQRGKARHALLGMLNGAFQALALQHYVDWPWKFRKGIPVIEQAEGLPDDVLPAYNLALIITFLGSALGIVAERRREFFIGHLIGLSTFPIQLASARRHQRWIKELSVKTSGLIGSSSIHPNLSLPE